MFTLIDTPQRQGTARRTRGRSGTCGGLGFVGFSESLPYAGFTGGASGDYRRVHAPWVSFTDVPRSANQPFTAFPTDAAAFSKLPAVSFVMPNVRHDMHDGTVRAADDWLRTNLDP